MIHIELSRSSDYNGEYFQICYQQDSYTKGRYCSFVPTNIPRIHRLNNTDLLSQVAKSKETHLKLKTMISHLLKQEAESLVHQLKPIQSYSELTFCDHLQPVAERIRQESLAWFGDSSFQVASAPDLLEGL